jgi:murein DD-endopeptidase MepM/ murein hydrolase activator NlpD
MPILLPLPFNSDGQEIRSAQGIDSLPSHKGHLKWGYDFTMAAGSDVLAQANGRVVGSPETVFEL